MNIEQEKKVLFEVATTGSKVGVCELVDLFYAKNTYWWYIKASMASLIIGVIYMAITNDYFGFLVSSVVIPSMMILSIWARSRAIKTLTREIEAIKAEKQLESKTFEEDRFIFSDHIFDYGQITSIVFGKVSVYLLSKNLFQIPLNKTAFTTGDYASFIDFLIEKLQDKPKIVKKLKKERRKLG